MRNLEVTVNTGRGFAGWEIRTKHPTENGECMVKSRDLSQACGPGWFEYPGYKSFILWRFGRALISLNGVKDLQIRLGHRYHAGNIFKP